MSTFLSSVSLLRTLKITYRLSRTTMPPERRRFRSRERASLDGFERPQPVARNAILADGREHHPASIGRDGHRAAIEELHRFGFADFEAHGLPGARLRSPRGPHHKRGADASTTMHAADRPEPPSALATASGAAQAVDAEVLAGRRLVDQRHHVADVTQALLRILLETPLQQPTRLRGDLLQVGLVPEDAGDRLLRRVAAGAAALPVSIS